MDNHSGKRGSSFRAAVNATIARQQVLPVVGVINAYAAIMAERIGHRALYLSGGGVAAGSYGLPDLGITTLHDVLEDVRRITAATALPLLVDIDTGFGGAFSIGRCIREMIVAGASAVHIEDQQLQKRCGHRPNKALVGADEMVDRIKAAVDARTDDSFVIMARTDALANEGLDAAVERSLAYIDAGADMLFPEAIQTLEQYQRFIAAVNVPVLANITEFGKTPLFTQQELADVGVAMALYPLSAFRAMNKAAEAVYQTILTTGSQQEVVDTMQTRAELYDYLGYHAYEAKLDALFQADNSHKTR